LRFTNLKEKLIGVFLALWFLGDVFPVNSAEPTPITQDALVVVQSYLRAAYARDFADAYRFISSIDHKVRDLNKYLQQRGPFNGFTLAVSRKLSEAAEIKTVRRQETTEGLNLLIHYKVPDPKKLTQLLQNWDPYRLNSLSAADKEQLLASIDKKRADGSLAMSEGEENFELIKEGNDWRVFLNWAAGVKIPLRLDLTKTSDLEVTLSKSEVVLQPGELFDVHLRITNRTDQPITARIGHLVEPAASADYLDFVQCGFLLPVTVAPAKEEEFSGTYMLRGSLPEGVRQLNLTYDFRLLK
jgi:cytochrome c oxidase assembly protein CtaG/Cox11